MNGVRADRRWLIAGNVAAVWVLSALVLAARAACVRAVCYTDLFPMWHERGVDRGIAPYFHGTYTPPSDLGDGAVEYPVFTGVAMWATAAPADSYRQWLLITALVAAVLASAVAVMLVRMVGGWAYVWSLSPAVALYSGYNWDLYAVLAAVLGMLVVVRGPATWSARTRGAVAAVLFGVGCLFKLYPVMYVLPLAIWLATEHVGDRRARLAEAARPFVIATAVVVAGNLPFAVFGTEGWKGSLEFQSHRAIDSTSMSVWFWWGALLRGGSEVSGPLLSVVTLVSMSLVLVAFGWAVVRGLCVRQVDGSFPWIPVAAAMTVAFMVFGKVNSPQFALWVLPFLVLLDVRLAVTARYLGVNLAISLGWFALPRDEAWSALTLLTLVTVQAMVLVHLLRILPQAQVRWSSSAVERPVGQPGRSA